MRTFLAEIAVDLSELETLIDDVLTATRFELADGIVEAHGGTIDVTSSQGAGTSVRVVVPLRSATTQIRASETLRRPNCRLDL